MNEKVTKSIFDELVEGLEASIAYSQGKLSLPSTTLPAPPPRQDSESIAALRAKYRMSQAVFAATLNVSPKTVQAWEQGLRTPSQASARLLQVLAGDPGALRLIFDGPAGQGKRTSKQV